MNVTRSRRHIYEQEVKFSPLYLQYHLFQRVAGHWPSPDECLALLCEIADRHPLHAEFFQRNNQFPRAFLHCARRHILGARHYRYRRTVNVGIGKSHLITEPRKSASQVNCNGAFANAALA